MQAANKMKPVSGKKRKRVRAARRWTTREVTKILRYVVKTGNFEKPTAREYYMKLVKDVSIDAAWDLLKFKMRYLKKTFEKAEQWLKGDPSNNTREKLLALYPHYDLLKIIFQRGKGMANGMIEPKSVNRDSIVTESVKDSHSGSTSLNFQEVFLPLQQHEVSITDVKTESTHILEPPNTNNTEIQNLTNNYNPNHNTEQLSAQNSSSFIPNTTAYENYTCDLSNYNPNMVINRLLCLEESRERNRMAKLNVEVEIQEKNILLEERKLDLEERKFNLEERKADRDYELRKMEMEMKERLGRYELELKCAQHK